MKHIIAITGKKFSGKTYLSNRLIDHFTKQKKTCEILSFATPLKNIMKEISMYSEDIKNSECKIKMYTSIFGFQNIVDTPRRCLQILGSDIIRSRDYDFFVRKMEKNIKSCESDYIIIDDLRFENEYNMLKDNNALVLKVVKETIDNDTHISEQFDMYDEQLTSGCDIDYIIGLLNK